MSSWIQELGIGVKSWDYKRSLRSQHREYRYGRSPSTEPPVTPTFVEKEKDLAKT